MLNQFLIKTHLDEDTEEATDPSTPGKSHGWNVAKPDSKGLIPGCRSLTTALGLALPSTDGRKRSILQASVTNLQSKGTEPDSF